MIFAIDGDAIKCTKLFLVQNIKYVRSTSKLNISSYDATSGPAAWSRPKLQFCLSYPNISHFLIVRMVIYLESLH